MALLYRMEIQNFVRYNIRNELEWVVFIAYCHHAEDLHQSRYLVFLKLSHCLKNVLECWQGESILSVKQMLARERVLYYNRVQSVVQLFQFPFQFSPRN